MSRRPAGVILTGGRSRRMGADKAFVVVAGRPMVVAVADALREGGCHRVECQGGDRDRLATLGLDAIADSGPGQGPVAAIVDALARNGDIVVAACDLPDLDGATVAAVVAAGQAGGRVAVAHADGRDHLLAYWPGDVLERLRADPPPRSYRAALERVGAVSVLVDPARVRNVNTEGDL